MSKYETSNELFFCSKLNKNVKIIRKKLLHETSSQKIVDFKTTISLECEEKNNCDVSILKGITILYDWSTCVYPELRK